ncbi:amidase [Rhodovulum sp. DZ06]|uniref:amidase n=1 Tax=Rhodovulum sp. DZ06 TaxID=3425126 RepID=UPI003D325B12
MSAELLGMTACDMGRAIAAGDTDPVVLTEAHLAAIEAHPEADRIYARTTPERARAEAAAAAHRARTGTRRGLLDGVPISWKDLFDSAGVATEAGSAMLAGRTPGADAEALARGSRAGLVCLGKTHMTELAFSGLGVNPVTATAPNRHDPDWAPGGSSSGAAASVAAGLAAAGIGSDTGGSIRIPPAWNDLVGLKTTHGRIPGDGTVDLAPSFDTAGPIARSVEDCAHLAAIMECAAAPDLSHASLEGRRFLVEDGVMQRDVREGPGAAFEDAVKRLEAAGAVIERGALREFADCLPLSAAVVVGEAWGIWSEVIEAQGEKMFPSVRTRFANGANVSAAQFVKAWEELKALRASAVASMAGYDAVLAPTAPILPPSVKRCLEDDAYYASENLLALRNTRVGNLLGLCSLTLPTGTPACGIMLTAAPNMDRALCRLGVAAEAALGVR